MQVFKGCTLGAALACILANPSLAAGPMLFDLGMPYGHDHTGPGFEAWNYSLSDPALCEPLVVNSPSAGVLSDHWTDQFWMVDAAGDVKGYRDVVITKANASEAWVTDPLQLKFDFQDMTSYAVSGPIELTITTRDAHEIENVVALQLPSDSWSSPTSIPLVLGPMVLQSTYPSRFDSDEQVTRIRVEMTVIPEPATVGLLVLRAGTLA